MDEFDFGDYDPGSFDFGDIDFGDIDFGDIDLSSLDEVDLSGLQDLDPSTVDFGPEFDQGTGGDFGGEPVDFALSSDDMRPDMQELSVAGDADMPGQLYQQNPEAFYVPPQEEPTDWQSLYNEGLTPEQVAKRESMMSDLSQYKQDFGGADTSQYVDEYQSNLKDIFENKGGFTSQWQTVGGDRVMVMDDGTGIKLNPQTGKHDQLTASQVGDMIQKGQLNTYKSGYNTATGGNQIAPGGGTTVKLKDGSTGTLMPNGRVIDPKTGTVIGGVRDVINKITTDGTGRTITTGSGGQGQSQDWLKLLLALAAMSASRGGSSSSAVIPTLSGGRSQTPYGELMKQPGYRPGQGGIQYFGPMIYRATGGGIASLDAAGGRLLQGPGDGVSDDIVAQIGDDQPARLADGEYVLDARTVSEIGNGSTDAGAKKIAQMVERIHSERKTAQRGKPSNADKHLLA
jgi:hypothetical protein